MYTMCTICTHCYLQKMIFLKYQIIVRILWFFDFSIFLNVFHIFRILFLIYLAYLNILYYIILYYRYTILIVNTRPAYYRYSTLPHQVANLLKDTWIPEPEPRVPEVAVQQPENDLLRGILQRRAEVTGNFMDPPPSYSSKVMSWDLRATAAVPGTGAAPPRERSVGLSRPQKRKQYAPQHADNRKYAGGGDSGATTPTPASRGGAREFGAELKQFVALLHSELDTVVERAMSKMTGKLSPPEQQLLAFNNNNNMSNNMNTSINNNNMNNNITNNNITNNNNNNNTAKLNFNDTANTATSLPLTNNGETGVDSVGFPIFPPPVSSYYSTPHHQMALLALQHATARGMSGGQLTSTTKQQQEPEQTEPMSLVLSTPKKRRTKVSADVIYVYHNT